MIDLHNHILPGLDDGARDLGDSVAIARQFISEGVTEVAATPHLDPLHHRGPTPGQVQSALALVSDALSAASIPLHVHPGQELFLTPEAGDLLGRGAALTLGSSRYVLVEVSLTALERPIYLDDTLFRLQVSGYLPILAHPERYPFVQRDPEAAVALAGRGVPLQLTAPSLLGEYGARVRRTAQRLLAAGAYGLAGSDRHRPGPARSLADLRARLQSDYAQELASLLLTENPQRVLANQPLLAPEPLPDRGGFSLARLFRR